MIMIAKILFDHNIQLLNKLDFFLLISAPCREVPHFENILSKGLANADLICEIVKC